MSVDAKFDSLLGDSWFPDTNECQHSYRGQEECLPSMTCLHNAVAQLDNDSSLQKFEQWFVDILHSAHAHCPYYLRLHVGAANGYRGLKSRKSLTAGECCLALPTEDPRLILTPFRCVTALNLCGCFVQPPNGQAYLNPVDCLVLFIFHLIAPARDNCPLRSIWLPYLRVLPKCYSDPSFVLMTSARLRQSLMDSKKGIYFNCQDLNVTTKRTISCVTKAWNRVRKILSYHQCTSTTEDSCESACPLFVWAWCTVNSRSVHCVLDKMRTPLGAERIRKQLLVLFGKSQGPSSSASMNLLPSKCPDAALVPFFDFFNHNPEVTSRFELGQDRVWRLFLDQSLNAEEEVFINYGPHDNLKLLVEYGFCLPLGMNPQDAIYPTSLDLLELFTDLYVTCNTNKPSRIKNTMESVQFTFSIILSKLALVPPEDIAVASLWPTVCVTENGPSYHLSLILYAMHSFCNNSNNLDDLFLISEDRIQSTIRVLFAQLLDRLLFHVSADMSKLGSLSMFGNPFNHSVSQFVKEVKCFLDVRLHTLSVSAPNYSIMQ